MCAERSSQSDLDFMDLALRLAKRALGWTSPNPMVGAVLVNRGRVIGQGWHHRAGEPHAEILALRDAAQRGFRSQGATLYVTLEPCSTTGRTPPCTEAILQSGIQRVVVGATDPNPKHAGRGFALLEQAGIQVRHGVRAEEATELNEAFNHWIVHALPFVTVKAALTADGKIATASGESKWITGPNARAYGMKLRLAADAILVGINTVLQDDPSLTVRRRDTPVNKPLRRLVLDARARTPVDAKIVADSASDRTTIITTGAAPARRVERLAKRVKVIVAPACQGRVDLRWLLSQLGKEQVTSLLVEGGGEVNASFLLGGLAQKIAFFYAPKIIGGRSAPTAVAGAGLPDLADVVRLVAPHWKKLGDDFLLTALVSQRQAAKHVYGSG